jgi:hypothetical protein
MSVTLTLASGLLFIIFAFCLPFKLAKIQQLELESRIQRESHQADLAKIAIKQQLIRYISHEIRTPIGIVNSSVSLAIDSLRNCDYDKWMSVRGEVLELLEDGLHACEGTVTVLNDMLSFEAMEAGKYKLYREFVPAVPTVKSIVSKLKSIGKAKNITFTVENQLEESAESYFYFDAPKIEQVFRNLATNSIKFSGTNSEIKVAIYREDLQTLAQYEVKELQGNGEDTRKFMYAGPISISFTDSGVGISPENLSKVFGEFNQFDPNKLQGGGGAGLGLHISRNIISSHEGSIRVASDGIGHGTSFIMSFSSFNIFDGSQDAAPLFDSALDVHVESIPVSRQQSGNENTLILVFEY